MLVELVTTGSELLLGEIVNENVRYLSQQLNNGLFRYLSDDGRR